MASLFESLGKDIELALIITRDPVLRDILDTIQKLGDRIATFFLRIKELIKAQSVNRKVTFVVDYFFRNYSIISEHTRASRSIIRYVLNKLDWLKDHSNRIIESLKSLYAELLSIQIDCEALYRAYFNENLDFDFGLDPEHEMKQVQQIMTQERAFTILNISEGVNRNQVKLAFRRLAKKLHPDINPDVDKEEFIQAENAYKIALAIVKK
ncbi:MAG: J domain-containing protein [Spirochaetales bacterium]|nr:J domain-containing protein [Spirochaetales bacterium]